MLCLCWINNRFTSLIESSQSKRRSGSTVILPLMKSVNIFSCSVVVSTHCVVISCDGIREVPVGAGLWVVRHVVAVVRNVVVVDLVRRHRWEIRQVGQLDVPVDDVPVVAIVVDLRPFAQPIFCKVIFNARFKVLCLYLIKFALVNTEAPWSYQLNP